MHVIELLSTNLVFLVAVATLFGLIVGSFLNVVIYRLPIMLERSWKDECRSLFASETSDSSSTEDEEKFNLIFPRSKCPECKTTISCFENIPLLSYLLQKGKCKHCQAHISIQYPLIELFTAITTGVVVYEFGFSIQSVAALFLAWALISLAAIDFKTTLLPDNITLPFLWLGILVNYFELFCSLEESVIGAIAGYLALWIVFQIFKFVTGKEGMGYGDFKLLALLGAWLGWQFLLPIILISSIVGSVVGITLIVTRFLSRDIPTPFGPYLAMGGIICLLWGDKVTAILPTF